MIDCAKWADNWCEVYELKSNTNGYTHVVRCGSSTRYCKSADEAEDFRHMLYTISKQAFEAGVDAAFKDVEKQCAEQAIDKPTVIPVPAVIPSPITPSPIQGPFIVTCGPTIV